MLVNAFKACENCNRVFVSESGAWAATEKAPPPSTGPAPVGGGIASLSSVQTLSRLFIECSVRVMCAGIQLLIMLSRHSSEYFSCLAVSFASLRKFSISSVAGLNARDLHLA